MTSSSSADSASTVQEQKSFRNYISIKECVGCKLFSTPMLYIIGLHMTIKNYNLYKEYSVLKNVKAVSRLDKFGLFVIPMVCFFGGSLNLYLALDILKSYKQEREMWTVMS